MDPFAAIANPARRRMLELLLDKERTAGQLAESFPKLSQPAVSRHLRVLREAGLAEAVDRGVERVYRVRREGLGPVDAWIGRFRARGGLLSATA